MAGVVERSSGMYTDVSVLYIGEKRLMTREEYEAARKAARKAGRKG